MGQKKIKIPKKDIISESDIHQSELGCWETARIQNDWKLRLPSQAKEFDDINDESKENFESKNKHDNIMIRKKFKKSLNYRCCGAQTGNPEKLSRGFCCTYPQVYRRRDITVQNQILCRQMDDDICLA